MSAVITLAMVGAAGACADQLALFQATFGDSVVVSRETAAVAIGAGVDVAWAGSAFLRGKFRRAYNAATAEAFKAYRAATAEAGKAYDAASAEARNAYNAALVEAFKAYNAATAEDRNAYHAATAEAFADAYIAQCQIGEAGE
jgi:phosphoenolpyruvate carboxylase